MTGLNPRTVAVAVALGCLAAAAPAGAKTLHMSPSGSGSACSAAFPCGSMDAAYRAAGLGDDVVMAGGSYSEQTIGARSLPGTDSQTPSGEEITFAPQPGASVSVDGLKVGAVRGEPVEHLTISGVTFTDWVATRSAADVHFVRTTHRAQVHTNWVHFLSYQGIEVGPFVDDVGHGMEFHQIDGRGGDNILVEGSYIHDVHPNNTAAHPDGVHIFGTFNDYTFRGNRLINNDHINYRGDGTMQRLVVENNFFGPARDPVVQRYYTAQIQGNGAVIRYNSFAGALQPSGDDERSGQVWEGNIMTWSTCDVTGSDSTVRHNVWVGGRSCGSASKSVRDARFVDAAAGDLHLLPDSPAIGAGNPASFPGSDVDGEGRPARGAPDAGADEWGAGGPAAPPADKGRPKRLVKLLGVRRTRRGYVLRVRLARRARVGAAVDRRGRGRYRVMRHVKRRSLRAGTRRVRLGRLHRGRYRVRVVAIDKGGRKARAVLRFRARRR